MQNTFDWRGLASKIARFGAISGTGLVLDMALFLILVRMGWGAGAANVVSATAGVAFVYFLATRHVFAYSGRFLLALFVVYLAYQAVAIAAASWAVGAIAALGVAPIVAKALVLPFTFSSNYVFMHVLTRRRGGEAMASSEGTGSGQAASARSGRAGRVLLFIPMYNCAPQIPRVIAQLTPDIRALLDEVIVVNNRSTDDGQAAAIAALETIGDLPSRVLLNDDNYGLGGSHKVAFDHALANGFDYVIVLHGDDQGSIADVAPLLRDGAHLSVDCLLGARFAPGSKLAGYSPLRTFGNHVFNLIYSVVSGVRIHDLGSGLNVYATAALADRAYLRHANDLTFNYHMILHSIAAKHRIRFFPLEWREDDQISNVKLVRQAMRVLMIPMDYLFRRGRYLTADHSGRPGASYTSTTVYAGGGKAVAAQ